MYQSLSLLIKISSQNITYLVRLVDNSLQGQITLHISLHSCWKKNEGPALTLAYKYKEQKLSPKWHKAIKLL